MLHLIPVHAGNEKKHEVYKTSVGERRRLENIILHKQKEKDWYTSQKWVMSPSTLSLHVRPSHSSAWPTCSEWKPITCYGGKFGTPLLEFRAFVNMLGLYTHRCTNSFLEADKRTRQQGSQSGLRTQKLW